MNRKVLIFLVTHDAVHSDGQLRPQDDRVLPAVKRHENIHKKKKTHRQFQNMKKIF